MTEERIERVMRTSDDRRRSRDGASKNGPLQP
jgi:hypothetical protein